MRVINAFVEMLDVKALSFSKAQTNHTGRKPYHPADLLKLYIYGYLNQIRSSRRLERECHRNQELLWLMKKLAPDFKTIADFRKDNPQAIRLANRQFIVLSQQTGLINYRLVAIDCSKFKAAASNDRSFNRTQLADQQQRLDCQVNHYLQQLDETDSDEVTALYSPNARR